MAYDIAEVSDPCLRSNVRSRFSRSGSSLSLGDSMAAERYMYGAEASPVCDFLYIKGAPQPSRELAGVLAGVQD